MIRIASHSEEKKRFNSLARKKAKNTTLQTQNLQLERKTRTQLTSWKSCSVIPERYKLHHIKKKH